MRSSRRRTSARAGQAGWHRERVKVQPLSPAAVASLADPAGLDAARLFDLTGGNPFFVTEVLATGGDTLPETVRDAMLARSATLSDPARRLLEAIAIVPGQTELWLLEQLAGEQLDQLDECLAVGMLRLRRRPSPSGTSWPGLRWRRRSPPTAGWS